MYCRRWSDGLGFDLDLEIILDTNRERGFQTGRNYRESCGYFLSCAWNEVKLVVSCAESQLPCAIQCGEGEEGIPFDRCIWAFPTWPDGSIGKETNIV